MRQVTYAGGTFVTGDGIADALLRYAAALANASRAATISVPAVDDFGKADDVQVLIGPSSQLMAEAIEGAATEPDPAEFVRDIDARLAELDSE